MAHFELHYGNEKTFSCDLPDEQVIWQQLGMDPLDDLNTALKETLAHPLDYPPVEQAIVPEDQVVLVVGDETPQWPEIATAVGKRVELAGVSPNQIKIVLNHPRMSTSPVPEQFPYKVVTYKEAMQGRSIYLASTAEEERIYLPEVIGEADYVITIGRFGFDEQWGYRGTYSIIYPAFASPEQQQKLRGGGHRELTPDDDRVVRQVINEVGWLLGLQYTVQVLPTATGKAGAVLSGISESVFHEGVRQLTQHWRSSLAEKADTVLVSVGSLPDQDHWSAIARACRAVERLVEADGRILILTDVAGLPEELKEALTAYGGSDELLRVLNRPKTPESIALHTLARLATQNRVYLLSRLENDLVENLFCIPLESENEMRKALEESETCAILDGGQFAYVDTDELKTH